MVFVGATKLAAVSGITDEMVRVKQSGQAESKVKSFGHLNGLAVHSLSKLNMPSTISERDSQKTGADIRRKSDSAVLSTKCDIRPLSLSSAAHPTSTTNGRFSQSLPASKSNTPNGCKVPSASTVHHTPGSKKRPESNNGDCLPKKSGVEVDELYCSRNSMSDSFVANAASGQKMHVQSNGDDALTNNPDVEQRSASKWNCCVNLHKKDRAHTFGNGIKADDEAAVVGSSSHRKSVGGSEKVPKHVRKPRTKPTSVSSTTKWHVMKCSDDGVLPDSSDVFHATTAWHITDVPGNRDSLVARTSDSASAVRQCDTSAAWKEAVCGGQDRMPSNKSVLHAETGDRHSTPVPRTVNCTYHYNVSLPLTYNFCCAAFDFTAWFLFAFPSVTST